MPIIKNMVWVLLKFILGKTVNKDNFILKIAAF